MLLFAKAKTNTYAVRNKFKQTIRSLLKLNMTQFTFLHSVQLSDYNVQKVELAGKVVHARNLVSIYIDCQSTRSCITRAVTFA